MCSLDKQKLLNASKLHFWEHIGYGVACETGGLRREQCHQLPHGAAAARKLAGGRAPRSDA